MFTLTMTVLNMLREGVRVGGCGTIIALTPHAGGVSSMDMRLLAEITVIAEPHVPHSMS
jgi:hypothetical protein